MNWLTVNCKYEGIGSTSTTKLDMIIRILKFDGTHTSSVDSDTKELTSALSNLKLPISPNVWKNQDNRDVSVLILNELIPLYLTSCFGWNEEFPINSGRVDLVRMDHNTGGLNQAIEVELGNSARSDSDILKLAVVGEQYQNAKLVIAAPSRKLLSRWQDGTKSAEGICKSLTRLTPIVKHVERISIVALDLPAGEVQKNHIVDLSTLSGSPDLFRRTKGVKKSDRRKFISLNRDKFTLSGW